MTQKPKIWLSSPHMGGTEIDYVKNAFDTNWIAPLGPHVNNFENDLAEYTGAKHVAALSSGTAALHLALIMQGVETGDYVICQSMTFSASANPIRYQGAIPVFIDSEPDTWNMNPEYLEEAIEACISGKIAVDGQKMPPKKPKAIIPVHLYGMPAKLEEIMAIAAKYDIQVIEDAAESLGSKYHGRHTGTFGRMGILSFNGNKIITTSGGGALISDDESLIQKARFLATQARDPAPHYQHSHIGYNYRMSNVMAGIGRGQMEVIEQRVNKHREIFAMYQDRFEEYRQNGFNIALQPEPAGMKSNRWLTAITLHPDENKGISREDFRLALEKENIESRPLWKPMHMQPVFENYPYFGDGTAEKLFDDGLCLPSGSNMSEEDMYRIFEVLDVLFVR
jgi:dTDP-4-amino-4,6-dideoxygalactose transaminase